MSQDKVQLMRDPEIHPTENVLNTSLKDSCLAYCQLMEKISTLDIKFGWHYYTDGKAWLGKGVYSWIGKRGGHKETTLFWLSIWDAFFRVTIYFPATAKDQLLKLELSENERFIILQAKQMGPKLTYLPITIDVHSVDQVACLMTLIAFKKSIC